ncbi:MAG: DUF4359 domain-containing protein [Bacteroidales bacterium]|jgi:hypothetical protein|nr:DUF4359 domain-containing protein [Bacteroidales bacterium]
MNASARKNRFHLGWIVLILILALLYATNPSEGQFTTYLKEQIVEQADGDETLTGALKRVAAGPASAIAGSGAERRNYFFFSTYRFTVLEREYLFLGILDNFFRIKKK